MEASSNHMLYLECSRTGYHYGEALNVVCLEPGCLDKALCCSACVEEDHRKHTTKPLKLIINEAKQYSSKITPINVNTETIVSLIQTNQKSLLESIISTRTFVNQQLIDMEKSVISFYNSMTQQVKLKANKSCDDIMRIFEEINKVDTQANLQAIVQKVISLIPRTEQVSQPIQESELIESINSCSKELIDIVSKLSEQIKTKSTASLQRITKTLAQIDIWTTIKYKFSTKLKHAQINIISPTIVKSLGSSSYKFALMEPDIQRNKSQHNKKLAFRIKQGTMNWLAVGVCHKNVVQAKNFSFSFNVLGHGAYMISSNGGSWSDTKSEANNSVKSFKFSKGDIILLDMNFHTKKMKFRKKGANDQYELDFQTKDGDALCPCVLFYYPNDEVEYLNDFKQ